jgi:P2 family phage contractile tail tube protein
MSVNKVGTPQTIVDAAVYVDGLGFVGRSDNEKIKLPVIEEIQESFKAGGFERDYGTGVFKKMEFEVVVNEYNKVIYQAMQTALTNGKGVTFTIKGSALQDGVKVPIAATIQAKFSIDSNLNAKVELMLKGVATRYTLEVNGDTLCSMDSANMIAEIGGVDYLETLRNHIL